MIYKYIYTGGARKEGEREGGGGGVERGEREEGMNPPTFDPYIYIYI
jgi:hypothetical protein